MMQIPENTVFRGKWSNQSFKIAKVLGEGANGAVYLVYTKNGYAAMKVCSQSSDAALEWHVLEQVSQVRASFPRPILIDDWSFGTTTVYFYIMESIPGESLDKALARLDSNAFQTVVEQVALGLEALHHAGMAFCDIKPQNILVATDGGVSVRFVDVGGVTEFGRSVRQFTPVSDRAFWDLGTRRAEPTYDICGLCLSLILSQYDSLPANLYQLPPNDRRRWLEKALRRYPYVTHISVLEAGLRGDISDAADFLQLWRKAGAVMSPTRGRHRRTAKPPKAATSVQSQSSSRPQPAPSSPRVTGRAHRQRRKPSHARHSANQKFDWTEWVMWLSLTAAAFVTCFAWATFLGWTP